MTELKIISIYIFTILCITGCYYDVEEELYPTIECQTDDMSYANDILPILEADCYACHSAAANFGNITLEGYSETKKHVDNGGLLGAVRHDSGFSPMPKNQAMILECEIEKIEAWIQDGAMDN